MKIIKSLAVIVLIGWFTFAGFIGSQSASWAQVPPPEGEEQQEDLSSQEKVDRAYDYREGAGIQEEKRQEENAPDIEESEGENPIKQLGDKVRDLFSGGEEE